jgi:hypothetical protein
MQLVAVLEGGARCLVVDSSTRQTDDNRLRLRFGLSADTNCADGFSRQQKVSYPLGLLTDLVAGARNHRDLTLPPVEI